ncbi:hypothetical protein Taro_031242 [Colocasia esculenta]|uniref:Uncharacterized protein n=1 Tax=Colocasia esculenta TaxID=4460 RepID=A0A843VYI3_COLES|nr:hypothetical protein [Colocasia esculenta]
MLGSLFSAPVRQSGRLGAADFDESWPIYTFQPWGEGILHGRALCPLHSIGILAEINTISGTSWTDYKRPLTATPTWMWFGSRIWGRVMRDSRGWCRPAPTSVGRCGCMHSTSCYLFTYSSASAHSAFERVPWCSPSETSFADRINNWEHRGKSVKSDATTDDAYLQAYALKYGGKVYKSARHQRVRLQRSRPYSTQRYKIGRRRREEGAGESEEHRSRRCFLFTSRRGSPSLREAQLARAVLRAKEAQRHLEERGQRDELQREIETTRGERDQLHIRAEAAEARVAEATMELAALRVQRSLEDQEEVTRLCAELLAQQAVARSLQEIVTAIGRSHSRSRSGASASRATGAPVGQYLVGSSSRRRNEEEERRRRGEWSAQRGRGGGEMPPPPDRQEGSEESGGGQ